MELGACEESLHRGKYQIPSQEDVRDLSNGIWITFPMWNLTFPFLLKWEPRRFGILQEYSSVGMCARDWGALGHILQTHC